MLLEELKETKSQKKLWTEHDGKSKLPNERLNQFLIDNPLDGVFDTEEHPDVKFRSYLECNERGDVLFAQIDDRLAPIFVLSPLNQSTIVELQKLFQTELYLGRFMQLNKYDNGDSYKFDTYYSKKCFEFFKSETQLG